MTAPVVFVDCETTGTDERYHDAWDIGVVWPDEQYEYRFRPPLDHADPAALRIGDYYARVQDGPSFGEAAYRTWVDDETLREAGDPYDGRWQKRSTLAAATHLARVTNAVTLVGVNPQFDARFMSKIIRAAGMEPTWAYRLIDLNSLARGYLLGLDRNPDSSGTAARIALDMSIGSKTLSERCGVERPDDHTALGDARWARDWYTAITSEDS